MSRYRKIEVRTWADERFRHLSPMQPSGQGLWFFLLTGPHTGPIPGLFRAGRAAMAEELDWDIEAFDEAFQEVFENGMAKADFKARLVWLPNAMKHNKPESPNVVRSWRVELDLLPECDLKNEAISRIREILESIGPSYVQAFDEVLCGDSHNPSSKASGKPSSKTIPNQEQEQEQYTKPPIAPQGGQSIVNDADASENQKRRQPSEKKVTFSKWIDEVRANGEKAVSDYAPVWKYADDCKLPYEFIELAWVGFKDYYHLGLGSGKRQADWRLTFLNNVKKNYQKLWFWSEKDNKWTLTTAGVQADRAAEVAA